MNEICNMTEVSTSDLRPLIHEIRGVQVMLDKDLAALYGVPTKRLNEQVRRNIERFPEDFMFQMSAEECSRSQIATMKNGRGKNIKYLPFAFTENGVAMLSSVLRSPTAIETNIRIMRAFVAMRRAARSASPPRPFIRARFRKCWRSLIRRLARAP